MGLDIPSPPSLRSLDAWEWTLRLRRWRGRSPSSGDGCAHSGRDGEIRWRKSGVRVRRPCAQRLRAARRGRPRPPGGRRRGGLGASLRPPTPRRHGPQTVRRAGPRQDRQPRGLRMARRSWRAVRPNGHDGELLTCSAPLGSNDPRLRRAQALATTSGVGLELARELLRETVHGQHRVLAWLRELQQAEADLARAATLARLRLPKARAAGSDWSALTAVTVRFAESDEARVPAHWRLFDARSSPIASDPASRSTQSTRSSTTCTGCSTPTPPAGTAPGWSGWRRRGFGWKRTKRATTHKQGDGLRQAEAAANLAPWRFGGS